MEVRGERSMDDSRKEGGRPDTRATGASAAWQGHNITEIVRFACDAAVLSLCSPIYLRIFFSFSCFSFQAYFLFFFLEELIGWMFYIIWQSH